VQSVLRANNPYFEQLEVWENGTPVIASHSRHYNHDVTYRTLAGEPISFEGDRPPTLEGTHLADIPKRKSDYRRRWGARIVGTSDGRWPVLFRVA